MSLLDELTGALRSAEGMVAALGPKPKGDPEGMRALSQALRAEAESIATIGESARGLPGTMVFEGPAARSFASNASAVGGAVGQVVARIEEVASHVMHEASKIERAQHEWEAQHAKLQHLLANLGSQIRATPR